MSTPYQIKDELIIDNLPVDFEVSYGEFPSGWGLWKRADGTHYVEYTPGPRKEVKAIYPWTMMVVYRSDVPDDVYKEHDWAAADASEADKEEGRSEDVKVRAKALVYGVGGYHGWDNIDGYPLELSAEELRIRWKISDEIPVPDEGTAKERAAIAAFKLFMAVASDPDAQLAEALAKGMTRVRRTKGETSHGSWGYAKVAEMLRSLDGEIDDTEELTMVCIDMKGLTCCAAGVNVVRESKSD
jgi:hypothetical protein